MVPPSRAGGAIWRAGGPGGGSPQRRGGGSALSGPAAELDNKMQGTTGAGPLSILMKPAAIVQRPSAR
eukprot:11871963-Alexandrium_andersonii.AAC.1